MIAIRDRSMYTNMNTVCTCIVFYIYFSKPVWVQKNFTQIFIYFSKLVRLLYSLIVHERVNFLSSLFTLCYFFLFSFYI